MALNVFIMTLILATVSEIQQEVGQRLRRHRLQQEWTQQALANPAGVSLGVVRTLEKTGVITLLSWLRIVQTLELSTQLDSLFAQNPLTIAQLDALEKAQRRQRSPRKST